MLSNLNNTNGKGSNAVVNKQIKDLQDAVAQLRTDVDQQEIDIASIDSELDDKVSKAEQSVEVDTALVKADTVKVDTIESKDEASIQVSDDVDIAGNVSAGEASFTKVAVNGVDIVDDLSNKVSCARTDAANAVCTANDALSCACNVQSDLDSYKAAQAIETNTVQANIGSANVTCSVSTNALTVDSCAEINDLTAQVVRAKAELMDAFIDPTEKDATDFYQFHLPVGFNGKARFVGTDEFGQVLFSAVFDTAFSSTGNNDREGTALVIHSGLTKYDFYQVLRRKDIDQISFITQSNIKRLSYSYENYDKDNEPTYEIWPNLTDDGPDYTLYNTKYEAEHSDQVVVFGNEDTLNGGLTIFGTFYATAFEVPETEVANVRVKHQIYGGYDCNTGEYETCGTPGGVVTYNQRSSSGECNVSWINGCPRQVVRKGVCYGKDGYDNECSYLTFETVKTKDSISGTFEPYNTDSLFDEAALASYEGKTSVASNLYPIKHLNCDTCVHGDITVECKVVTDCICSENGLYVCSDYNITESAENKITNVTCNKTENILGSSFENITANKVTCACAVIDCASNITLSSTCKNRFIADCGTEVECGLTVDKLKVTDCVDGRLEVNGDIRAHGQLISEGDAVVHGDLYVEGTTITTTEKEVNTSGDYVTLREGNNSPLSNTEYSGIVVNNYQTGCMATLTSDSCGTWRVSDTATSSATVYADVSQYKNVWYDCLTQTTVTVNKGVTKNVDAVELDNVAIDSGNYYHKNGSDWYGPLTIVSGQFDLGSIVTDATLIAALEAQSADDLVYYNSLTIAVIDASTNQPLLTRDEETNLEDNDILVWDDANKKAVSMTRPTQNNTLPVANVDSITGCVSYTWKSAAGGTVCRYATMACATAALQIAEGCNGYIPDNALVVIDDEFSYTLGETR